MLSTYSNEKLIHHVTSTLLAQVDELFAKKDDNVTRFLVADNRDDALAVAGHFLNCLATIGQCWSIQFHPSPGHTCTLPGRPGDLQFVQNLLYNNRIAGMATKPTALSNAIVIADRLWQLPASDSYAITVVGRYQSEDRLAYLDVSLFDILELSRAFEPVQASPTVQFHKNKLKAMNAAANRATLIRLMAAAYVNYQASGKLGFDQTGVLDTSLHGAQLKASMYFSTLRSFSPTWEVRGIETGGRYSDEMHLTCEGDFTAAASRFVPVESTAEFTATSEFIVSKLTGIPELKEYEMLVQCTRNADHPNMVDMNIELFGHVVFILRCFEIPTYPHIHLTGHHRLRVVKTEEVWEISELTPQELFQVAYQHRYYQLGMYATDVVFCTTPPDLSELDNHKGAWDLEAVRKSTYAQTSICIEIMTALGMKEDFILAGIAAYHAKVVEHWALRKKEFINPKKKNLIYHQIVENTDYGVLHMIHP